MLTLAIRFAGVFSSTHEAAAEGENSIAKRTGTQSFHAQRRWP